MKPPENHLNPTSLPIKVIQFGEGNFLRAFVDWMIDYLNEHAAYNTGVAVVPPRTAGQIDRLNDQHGRYHLLTQGVENGKLIDELKLITCIQKAVDPFTDLNAYFELAKGTDLRLIFSNTTEAGIAFDKTDLPIPNTLARTFPGKLTQLLKHRFDHFQGDRKRGVAIIPCELINQNGAALSSCVKSYIQLWGFDNDFQRWVDESCTFANTLVDRIVPGYPKSEIEEIDRRIGYHDPLVVKAESFHLFVIEAPDFVQDLFPAHRSGLNVKYVTDLTPYRTQKVRILNGTHTFMVPIGLLNGIETVGETMEHPEIGKLILETIFEEIVPTIQIPGEDPREFADQVISRFKNPFIRHELISISLNSISKFKVRVLPTIMDFHAQKGHWPKRLTFSLSCLIHLYTSRSVEINDDPVVLDFFESVRSEKPEVLLKSVLSNTHLWGMNLFELDGFYNNIHQHYNNLSLEKLVNSFPH